MNSVFDAYAAYYDLLYKDKDYSTETHFVHELLVKHGVRENASLLELGCGTGMHAEEFARLAYRVHGVDLSPKMVEAANSRKLKEFVKQLEFAVGDLRTLDTGKTFDAVVSLFHVASYQITNVDISAMFKTAAKHLKPDGVFLFDCWYGPAVLTNRPVARTKRIGDGKIQVLRTAEPVMHPNENVVDVNYTVKVMGEGNEPVSEFHEKHRMRYLFSPEIELMLNLAGMRLVDCVEWLTADAPGFESWTATFVAAKDS